MAKKVEVEIDIQSNVEPSISRLKELKKQLKETAAGSADFKRLSAEIRDVEDAIQGAKLGADDFAGALEAAPGPVGKLFQAIKKVEIATKSWGAALKATGIGLIVAAVGGLVAAFTQTEGAMKKLEPILIGFEKILGGIFEAFQPVLDAFLEMATKALPYITSGIKIFYSSLFGLFTLVKEAGVGVGKIIKGIFTLDTDSIKEGWDQLAGGWSKTVEAYNATSERFEAGTKKLTKTEKENLKERTDAADKALQEKIKQLEAEDKLDEARLAKLKAEAMQTAFNDEQKLAVEQAFYEKSYQLKLKDIEDKQKLFKKESVEYKALEADKINLQAENLDKTKEFNEKLATILKERADKITEFEIKLAADLQKIEDEKLEKRLKDDARIKGEDDARYLRMMTGAQMDLELQRELLEQKRAADEQYYATQLANEKLTAEQIRELNDRRLADQIFYTQKSNEIELNRIAVKQQALDDIISIAGAETNVGRAALVAKQLLAAKEMIMEIKRTITFSAQAAARSVVAVAEGTAQTAKVGFPQNIPLLIGYAAQAFGIISAIKSAVSSAKSSVSGGGVQNISAPAPTFGSIPSMETPQINTVGGSNPSQQIAETLTQSQKPVRAYVVSQEMSSQQALDRRTNVAATFG